MLKKGHVILLFVALILFAVILYINISLYSAVIRMGVFATTLCLVGVFSVNALVKKEESRSTFIINLVFLTLVIIMFIIAKPSYTYKEAQELVLSEKISQEDFTEPELLSLGNKTVPTNASTTWLVSNRLYYIAVQDRQDNEISYYLVEPNDGKLIELDEAYW